ncbi:MAG: transketolase [Bacteroidales bacterium]|nr:transketolase [Bacteroidales bacterium]
MMDNKIVNRASDNIRILSLAMVEKAKSGHPGGAMGGADFVSVLYSEFLNYNPDDRKWFFRDRFFMDPGHMSPMLYAILAMTGTYNMEDLKNFRQWGSVTPGHPEVDFERGVENTSGPLGQGHTMAVGAAIAERFLAARFGEWTAHKTYAFISDGGIQEEIAQGAGRIAGHLGLNNLIMFYDANDIQLSTVVNDVTAENTAMKYEAWGWRVVTIDGNNADQIREALKQANEETEKPFLIIGKTIMGKGLLTADGTSFERKVSTHGQPVSAAGASPAASIVNLGGDAENPFVIFDEVKDLFEKAHQGKREAFAAKIAQEEAWRAENAELAAKLDDFIAGRYPEIDYRAIAHKDNVATREASSNILKHYATAIENMIISSADLSNSDKTDGFIKGGAKPFAPKDFTGGFLNAGVAELTMASIANGISLHGGVHIGVGTFFVFSDYMKPAVRIAALQQLPVKYVWTHDAFRVGEDGPTHQPIEQEAQIRLLAQMRNHAGKRSMLVIRPADAAETSVAWKMAMENTDTPTGLILSRQGIKNIPALPGSDRFTDALQAEKGAYIVKEANGTPDVILVGSGSEVSTLLAGCEKLEAEKGLNIRVVSAPSEGLFRDQSAEYQNSILPNNAATFGLTAGLPVTLQGLVGGKGRVFGMEHFGYSAPANILDEKFGFTAENVFNQVNQYLVDYKSM